MLYLFKVGTFLSHLSHRYILSPSSISPSIYALRLSSMLFLFLTIKGIARYGSSVSDICGQPLQINSLAKTPPNVLLIIKSLLDYFSKTSSLSR